MGRNIIYIALFILIAFGIWLFFLEDDFGESSSKFKIKTKEIDVGYRGYAARNKLLAAHRFLESLGESVQSQQHLSGALNKLGQFDFIMVLNHGRNITNDEAKRLLDWVKKGGRLVIGPRRNSKNKKYDILFQRLRIRQTRETKKSSTSLKYFDSGKSFKVNFINPVRLNYRGHRVHHKISDAKGVVAYRIKIGQGTVFIYADLSIFTNKKIASYDHAALLNYAANPGKPKKYWFVYGNDSPSLFGLILNYLWAFLIAISTIFVLWVWKAFQRFGPMLAQIKLNRRSLLEHIRGVGSLQWNNNGRKNLLMAVQRTIQQRIEIRHPDWRQLSENDLFFKLSESSGLSEEIIKYAIKSTHVKNEYDFLRLVQTLNQIRNAL